MHTSPRSYKQLQAEDRMTIASLKQQNYSIRQIASLLQRSASRVSRELSRNSEQGTYASVSAQQSCRQRRCQSRPARKLHPQSVLFGMVRILLCSRWSPEQITLTLARLYPKGHKLRVSHETIYNCIYAQPVGELRKELIANLRQARNKRTPRSKGQDRRGHIPDMLSIHVRPPEPNSALNLQNKLREVQKLLRKTEDEKARKTLEGERDKLVRAIKNGPEPRIDSRAIEKARRQLERAKWMRDNGYK